MISAAALTRFDRAGRGLIRSVSSCLAAGTVAIAIAIVLLPVLTVPGSAASAAPASSDSVLMTVDRVTPSVPLRGYPKRAFEVQLSVTNQTSHSLNKLTVTAERGDPITTQVSLDQALAKPDPPSDGGIPIPAKPEATFSVAAGKTVDVSFRTVSSFSQDDLCVCGNGVYPLFLTARRVNGDATGTPLGTAATYVPVFYQPLPRLRVGWVWPVLERPHRLTSDTLFIDDGLTTALSAGGRLDHLLSVLEELDSSTPLTVLFDPETIDEIEVMTGKYQIRSNSGFVAGTGQSVATAWLTRLRAALSAHPNYRIELTPYADPDVQSLTDRGYHWQRKLPAAMATRVATALGGVTTYTDLAWPVAPRLSKSTLTALSRSGVTSVVLSSNAVRIPSVETDPQPATARLASGDGDLAGLIVNPDLAANVSRAVSVGGTGAATLPTLMSELAVRVTADPSSSHAVVLIPPRDVDPSVSDAVAAIATTTVSPFTSPITVPEALSGTFLPQRRSSLRAPSKTSSGLSASILDTVGEVTRSESTITSLLSCTGRQTDSCTDASSLLAALPATVQRTESSAWRRDTGGTNNAGDSSAHSLATLVRTLTTGVRIAPPSGGGYTLGSSSAPIPITVVNDLDYSANVIVRVTTVGGLPGFSTDDIGSKLIPAHKKTTIQLPANVQRTGGFRVQASLTTPNGAELGTPVVLTVHSTALGRVGVIITITAGALLVLALLYRTVRGLLRRRRRRAAFAGSRS